MHCKLCQCIKMLIESSSFLVQLSLVTNNMPYHKEHQLKHFTLSKSNHRRSTTCIFVVFSWCHHSVQSIVTPSCHMPTLEEKNKKKKEKENKPPPGQQCRPFLFLVVLLLIEGTHCIHRSSDENQINKKRPKATMFFEGEKPALFFF